LVKAITVGLEVDVVEFPDDDEDLRVAYCLTSHDEAVNSYKCTCVTDMVGVAMLYHAKAPGGNLDHVQGELTRMYGQDRKNSAHQMLVAAQTLPKHILDLLDEPKVPNEYI
jgi:hypothetical protein